MDKDAYIIQLVTTNEALAHRLADLNKRKMARNTTATNQWRRKAFYFKQRCASLVDYIKQNGLEVPKTGGTDESSDR